MIVYQSTKTAFCQDAESGAIDQIILGKVKGALGMGVGPSEVRSWHQSLAHMSLVLNDPDIPDDTGVGIEYQIPQATRVLGRSTRTSKALAESLASPPFAMTHRAM